MNRILFLFFRHFLKKVAQPLYALANALLGLCGEVQAEGVLTFAGYDARTNSIWYDSGRGYTRTGKVVPDVAAPAVEVSTIDMRGRNSTLTGTSAAAALGAGACALLLEWGIVQQNAPAMDSVTIQRYLIRGASRSENYTYPNKTWGYGLLDLYGVFQAIRGI